MKRASRKKTPTCVQLKRIKSGTKRAKLATLNKTQIREHSTYTLPSLFILLMIGTFGI